MTGFGKADATYGEKRIHVVVKTLNSKTLDINSRIAPQYRDGELELRNMISARVTRGKVDFAVTTENASGTASAPINPDAVKAYVSQIKEVSAANNIPLPSDWWSVLSRLYDTTSIPESSEIDNEEWDAVKGAMSKALDALVQFRTQEGAALQKKFEEKIDNISALLLSIEPYEKSRVPKIRERIETELSQLKDVDIDRGRLEQEMIYYIEKLDVSEEKQRLTNHLKYFLETLDGPAGQGKKLGFIAQEMGREINTLGSKSNIAEMQNIVVKMKDELEQIKEQVLNAL